MKSIPSVGSDVVEGDDIRVIEGAGGPGLLDEALLAVGIEEFLGRKDLDGDRAIEVGVACLVDDTHAALAKLLVDAVAVEGATNHGLNRTVRLS